MLKSSRTVSLHSVEPLMCDHLRKISSLEPLIITTAQNSLLLHPYELISHLKYVYLILLSSFFLGGGFFLWTISIEG